MLRALVLTAYALVAFRQTYAGPTNITIDDTNSTFWTFVGSYNAITPSTPCSGCVAKPNPALAFNNTWHDGALRSGSFVFQGSAVYIYGIDVTNPANVTFGMSNPSMTSFHYYSGDGYIYNSLFFSATGLDPSVQHVVTWLMEQSAVGGESALFDYAVVTLDATSSFSSTSGSSSRADSTTSTTGSRSSSGASLTSISSSASSAGPSGTTTNSAVSQINNLSKTGAIVGALSMVIGLFLLGD